MSDFGDDGFQPLVGRIPSVQTKVIEAGENRLLVEQAFILFVASMLLLVVGYAVVNIAGYRIGWMWPVLVRAALTFPAITVGMKVSDFFAGQSLSERLQDLNVRDVEWWLVVVVPVALGAGVWLFLAGGDIATFIIWSFDYPEGAEFGVVVERLAAAVAGGVMLALCMAMLPLINRMRAELQDRYHAPVEVAIREKDWEIEQGRAKLAMDMLERGLAWEPGKVLKPVAYHNQLKRGNNKRGGGGDIVNGSLVQQVAAVPEPKPTEEHVLVPQDEIVGVRGYSNRAKKYIDVHPDKARYFIEQVGSGARTLARSSWANSPLSLYEWDAMVDVLDKAGLISADKKHLSRPTAEVLALLYLAQEPGPDAEGSDEAES